MLNSSNINDVINGGLSFLSLSAKNIDFLSLDIDGYDHAVIKSILSISKPRVLCLEYNPELRPPLKLHVDERNYAGWNGTHFHGASLQSLYELSKSNGYSLVGCSASGYNSFFIKDEDLKNTNLRSLTAEEAYQPAREYLTGIKFGHKTSFDFFNQIVDTD